MGVYIYIYMGVLQSLEHQMHIFIRAQMAEFQPGCPVHWGTCLGDLPHPQSDLTKIMKVNSGSEQLTDGCWSPTRPSLFFTTRMDGQPTSHEMPHCVCCLGFMEAWDMIETQHSPIMTVKVQEGPLHCLSAHPEVSPFFRPYCYLDTGFPGLRGWRFGRRIFAGTLEQSGDLHQSRKGLINFATM